MINKIGEFSDYFLKSIFIWKNNMKHSLKWLKQTYFSQWMHHDKYFKFCQLKTGWKGDNSAYCFYPSSADTTFVQSTRTQRLLKNI